MHRLIVTSATYRQSSRHRPDLATLDARNRLLARQNRLRLDAEVVRDVALAASGLLTRTVGGPSVFPPQPKGVYAFTQVPRNWKASSGADRYRRGLYTYFWRSAPHPGPDRLRRPRGVVHLHAPQSLQHAAASSDAAQRSGLLTSSPRRWRAASLRESKPTTASASRYALPPVSGTAARARANGKRSNDCSPVEQRERNRLDAWTSVARVLLNLDEFITRE